MKYGIMKMTRAKGMKLIRYLMILVLLGMILFLGINGYVVMGTGGEIVSVDELQDEGEKADAVLVLGAQVKPDGSPSKMLQERLDTGIMVYKLGLTDRMIMSGDHGREDYDEVNTMKNYAVSQGVPSEHIFMDHAGFSTYESMYRAKEIFQAENLIIVTQEYHIYRALYDAKAMEIRAKGVVCDTAVYSGDTYRKFRESVARVKDAGFAVLKPKPTFLGDVIPVSGDGNITNDI